MYRQPKGKYVNGELERLRTKYGEHGKAIMERNIHIYRKFELETLDVPICHSHILTKLESTRPLPSKCSVNPFKVRDKTAFFPPLLFIHTRTSKLVPSTLKVLINEAFRRSPFWKLMLYHFYLLFVGHNLKITTITIRL